MTGPVKAINLNYIGNWGRIFSAIIFTLLLSISANAQVSETLETLTPEEREWIAANPVLKTTNNMDLIPLDFVENGRPMGFAIDYLNLVASKIGVELEFINGKSWIELVDMARNREIDIIHSLVQNPRRDEFLHFTTPYLNHSVVTYGRVGEPRLNSIEDIADKRIGVIKGWAITDYYQNNHPEFTLIEFTGILDALRAISNNEIDVMTGSMIAVDYYISQYFLRDIVIIGDDFAFNTSNLIKHRLASTIDKPILRDILQKGMDAITDEEYEVIIKKWNLDHETEASIELGLTIEERTWLAANETIKAASTPDTAPLDFVNDNGEISGISGSYLRRISDLIGVKIEWVGNNTWAEGYQKLLDGEADIISLIIPYEERREDVEFTENYANTSYVIFARDDGAPLITLDAMEGKKLVQVRDYEVTNNIKRDYPDIEMVIVDTPDEAVKTLSVGGADAYVGIIPVMSYHMAEYSLTNIRVAGSTEYRTPYAIGISKDKPILASIMKKAMRHFSETEKAEINREWLSLTINQEQDYTLLFTVTLGAACIIIIVLFWVNKLKLEINRRKAVEKELNRALDVRATFFGHMSHELRTPLNAIIGFAEMLPLHEKKDDYNERVQEYADYITSGGKHLLSLVNDLLDQNKIETGAIKVSIETLKIDDLLKTYIAELNPITKENSQTIELITSEPIGTIQSDRRLFKQIIVNILSNAQKYSPNGETITIQVTPANDNNTKISIKDNGDGISEDILEELSAYKDKQKAHFIANAQGTGLGLIIVHQLMLRLDGTLDINTEKGKGTEIALTFPNNHKNAGVL
ncbi:transporter substrate-binding domain-containing protein [Pseudemcibacter aquimaris]|uniref:transporter substrate-binding domain-containing protein n=1 Tax=Pseudemcibacter aquimaris TaxID=2857064 RepID=UPI0020111A77|nr:transporter substrate-binding domain-containing protein [Pseudemcibacter aquimaris]MCC3860194.1 transporter substrate-binding domain-containing protein [Pseudemcibacter aquimaris]WDU57519.1 transporter substrate-binding domain-containing protein [Pseudemcibacter aquimaris]